jgi:hypothetical protein
MRNTTRFYTPLMTWFAQRRGLKLLSKHSILALALSAALLSWGCPQDDPLQAFNTQKTTTASTGTTSDTNGDSAPAPVPEPATTLLFGAALLIGGGILRRRRSRSHS